VPSLFLVVRTVEAQRSPRASDERGRGHLLDGEPEEVAMGAESLEVPSQGRLDGDTNQLQRSRELTRIYS
jgi:hypothetical protein